MPLTGRGGWTLNERAAGGRRQWYVTSPDGAETTFDVDGGLFVAIDMANLRIDGVTP